MSQTRKKGLVLRAYLGFGNNGSESNSEQDMDMNSEIVEGTRGRLNPAALRVR